MVFHRNMSDSKYPVVSRTRLRILAVLSNAVIWIVCTRPPTSNSSKPFNNPLVIVPKAPISIATIVTYTFYSFFNSLARSSTYLSFHILSVLFCGQPGQQSWQFCKFSFFWFIIISSAFWPRLGDPFVCSCPISVWDIVFIWDFGSLLFCHLM